MIWLNPHSETWESFLQRDGHVSLLPTASSHPNSAMEPSHKLVINSRQQNRMSWRSLQARQICLHLWQEGFSLVDVSWAQKSTSLCGPPPLSSISSALYLTMKNKSHNYNGGPVYPQRFFRSSFSLSSNNNTVDQISLHFSTPYNTEEPLYTNTPMGPRQLSW